MIDALPLPPERLPGLRARLAGAELELFKTAGDWRQGFLQFYRKVYEALAAAYQGAIPTEHFIDILETRLPAAVLQRALDTHWIREKLFKQTQETFDSLKGIYLRLGREWEDLPARISMIYRDFDLDNLIKELALTWTEREHQRVAELIRLEQPVSDAPTPDVPAPAGIEQAAQELRGAVGAKDTDEKASRRARLVMPILELKGWTPSRWALKAGVDPSVVYDYLKGTSNPRSDSRRALAEVIGLTPAELP